MFLLKAFSFSFNKPTCLICTNAVKMGVSVGYIQSVYFILYNVHAKKSGGGEYIKIH